MIAVTVAPAMTAMAQPVPPQGDLREQCFRRAGGLPRDQRMETCTTLLARTPLTREDRAESLFSRGQAYLEIGPSHVERAIRDLDDALQLIPNDGMVLHERGTAFFLTRQYDRAIADVDAALQRVPGNPSIIDVRARALALKAQAPK